MNAQRSRSASVKSSRELYTRGIHETCEMKFLLKKD